MLDISVGGRDNRLMAGGDRELRPQPILIAESLLLIAESLLVIAESLP